MPPNVLRVVHDQGVNEAEIKNDEHTPREENDRNLVVADCCKGYLSKRAS